MIQYRFPLLRWLAFAVVPLWLAACGGSDGGGGGVVDTTDLGGVISAPQSTDADGDVNQISSAPVSNQSFTAAQSIPNPATIGGYVNLPFAGPTLGHSSDSGDERDMYRITAAQNQTLRLTIAEANNDLDMHLLDGSCSDGNGQCQTNCAKNPGGAMVVASSTANGNTTEQITVPTTGIYYVEVCAASGASNYLLTIGQSILSAGGFDPSADFVPGEVIVRFRDNAIAAAGGDRGIMAASVGLQAKAGGAGRAMLMDIGAGTERQRVMRNLGITRDRLTGIARATGVASSDKRDTLAVVEALRSRADVLSADPNYYRYPLAAPGDNSYPLQWHYPLINLPQAWDIETGQTNPVTVAVIDTGVLASHPDLQGKLTGNGYDFIRSTAISNDGDGIDTNPDDPGDGSGGAPSSFHGTHVAGTVGARTNDADSPSVAGVTWGGMIMPLRVLGVGGGTSYDIMQAVAYAAGQANDAPGAAGQDQGAARADVINLSLGGGGFSASEEAAYLSARDDRNVIIVAAAGNDGTSTISYPAGYNGVVSTSAITLSKSLAPYSQFGSTIDVAAPGGDLSQDLNGDGYGDGVASTSGSDSGASIDFTYVFENGTSMASPHVAGVAALMRSVNPGLTPNTFDGHLISGALTEDLGGDGPTVRNNSFGYGMIDAAKAVVAAGGVLQPSLAANPASINFGTATSSTTLSVQLFGGAALVAPVTASTNEGGNWLTLEAPLGGNMSAGVYQVLADRSGLAEGIYTGQIVLDSDANDVTVSVILQVSNAPVTGNAGHQIVLLFDVSNPTNPLLVDVANAAASNGQYTFQFSNVSPGEYFIMSGSDNDYDGFICDSGESCGAYPDLNSNGSIIVGDADVGGLDFLVSYELVVTNQALADRIGQQGFRYPVD